MNTATSAIFTVHDTQPDYADDDMAMSEEDNEHGPEEEEEDYDLI